MFSRTGAAEFAVPSEWPRARVRRLVGRRLDLKAEGARQRMIFYDTFDWRLHRAGYTLELAPGRPSMARLRRLDDGRAEAEQELDGEPPRFVHDWPRGPVGAAAARACGIRALMPQVALAGGAEELAVVGAEGKTVCRLSLERWRVEKSRGAEAWQRIRVMPLRGFDEEAAQVFRVLADTGLPLALTPTLDTGLAAIGRRPRDYSSKFRLELDAGAGAAAAVRAILARLLDDLERNEQGTRCDIDPEFLHDYRVAVRRTRSALSVLGRALDPEAPRPFVESFRELGRVTGGKRNLDVHLLDFDAHLALLDAPRREALAELRRVFEVRRDAAGAELAAYLASPGYRDFKRRYRRFVDAGTDADPGRQWPLVDFAGRVIWKTYRKILEHGRAIDASSPDEALHDLRKRGKKLRYLMEFFQDLYPRKGMKPAHAELKALQDHLGLFQDQCVQIETLEALGTSDIDALAAAAVNELVDGLTSERRRTRAAFADHFARFDAPARRARFAALFKPSKCADKERR